MAIPTQVFVEGRVYRVIGKPKDENAFVLDRVAFIQVDDPTVPPVEMPDSEYIIRELEVTGNQTEDFEFDSTLMAELDAHKDYMLFGTFKEKSPEPPTPEEREVPIASDEEYGTIEVEEANANE